MPVDLIALRHTLHRRPEVGLQLPRTQQTLLDALAPLSLEVSRGDALSSVVAVLRGAGAPPASGRRPVILLRADLDALPVTELADVPYRSEVEGVMHACGHDLHAAMLVGAAHRLAARREELPGDVVLMFQPGEEGFDGAGLMIGEGVLGAAGRAPDAAFALHAITGMIGHGDVTSRPGPLMAASDGVRVVVVGRGGHAGSPHLAVDPLPAACAMVLALQAETTRALDAFSPHVFTVGRLQAGTRRNVIAETAEFEATLRTFDPLVRDRVLQVVHRVCQGVAATHGVRAEVEEITEYPVTVNDPAAVDLALRAAEDVAAAEPAVPGPPSPSGPHGPTGGTRPRTPGRPRRAVYRLPQPVTGSEDFSRVLQHVPGAMLFVGATPRGADPATAAPNHSPRALFDDAALAHGADLLTATTVAAMSGPPGRETLASTR